MRGRRWKVQVAYKGELSRSGEEITSGRAVSLVEVSWAKGHQRWLTFVFLELIVALVIGAMAGFYDVLALTVFPATILVGIVLLAIEFTDRFGANRTWSVPENLWALAVDDLEKIAPAGAWVTHLEREYAQAAATAPADGGQTAAALAIGDQLAQARIELGVAQLEVQANLDNQSQRSRDQSRLISPSLQTLVDRSDRAHGNHSE